MAAESKPQPASGGGLSQKFMSAAKWVGHHLFSPTMIFMMVAMALPGVAAAATAVSAKATLGDIGLAVFDHYKTMFIAPFTEFGTVTDAFSSAAQGNWAAGSYELGAHAHGAAAGASHAAMGHTAATSCAPFADWSAGLDSQNLEAMNTKAGINGLTLEQQYTQDFCK